MIARIGRIAEINPGVNGFANAPDEDVTFMPLECVWPDGRADTTRRAKAGVVSSGYTLFCDGDVLLPKITPTFEAGRVFPVSMSTELGAGTTELHILRVKEGNDPRYVAYVCRSAPFLQEGAACLQGVGNLRRVPIEFVAKFPVVLTEEVEQRRVADFLDAEVRKIDLLVGKQRALTDALQRRRQSLIEASVTTGLEQSPRVDTVEAWPATLPEHWRLVPAKAVFGERREVSWPTDVHLTPSQSHGVLSQAEYIEKSGTRVVLNLTGQDRMKHVEEGDFIIHLRSFQGGIEHSGLRGKVSMAYTVLTPRGGVDPRYFRWALKTTGYVQALRSTTNQLRDGQSISYADFSKVKLPLPPIDEQRRIAAFLDERTAAIDSLIQRAARLIELAQERRAALITAAVVGEIDVAPKAGT